jgi:hypothetical protein
MRDGVPRVSKLTIGAPRARPSYLILDIIGLDFARLLLRSWNTFVRFSIIFHNTFLPHSPHGWFLHFSLGVDCTPGFNLVGRVLGFGSIRNDTPRGHPVPITYDASWYKYWTLYLPFFSLFSYPYHYVQYFHNTHCSKSARRLGLRFRLFTLF